jgi:hypothetical protein
MRVKAGAQSCYGKEGFSIPIFLSDTVLFLRWKGGVSTEDAMDHLDPGSG